MLRYAYSPQPEAFLSGIRPLLREFVKLHTQDGSAEAQIQMLTLIGFIGGAISRNPAPVLTRLKALMLTQNDLTEVSHHVLTIFIPALALSSSKEAYEIALVLFALSCEAEALAQNKPKPSPSDVVNLFSETWRQMSSNVSTLWPLACLGRYWGTGDSGVIIESYQALNAFFQRVQEQQGVDGSPSEIELAILAKFGKLCGLAYRIFVNSSPAAAKVLADHPVDKSEYPFAYDIVRNALDAEK